MVRTELVLEKIIAFTEYGGRDCSVTIESQKSPVVVRRIVATVAIPACNEAVHIERCLAALALQRDEYGGPIPRDSFEILILVNNSTDHTAELARATALRMPHQVTVVELELPADRANAGGARKFAMDLAAKNLFERDPVNGIIFTTDADTVVSPTWFAANMTALNQGADCVAGYIDGDAVDLLKLGPTFLARGRLEDAYLRLVAEIYARCDPRLHDPWPNHRVSSGASLAVRLPAHLAIGGLPVRALGEDAAFTQALDDAGFKVRHPMTVSVSTSCRLDGRAKGGAADTMRHRHRVPDAPCDAELEPALHTARRALYRGLLRRYWHLRGEASTFAENLRFGDEFCTMVNNGETFSNVWQSICESMPQLRRGEPLRPSDLPRQIAIARMVLQNLCVRPSSLKNVPVEKRYPAGSSEQVV